MSLALPRAPPSTERMSVQLPSITCSACGVQLPLDQLGEHVCGPAPAPAVASAQTAPAHQRGRERSGTASSAASPVGGHGAGYSSTGGSGGGLGVGPMPAQAPPRHAPHQQQQHHHHQAPQPHHHAAAPSLQLQMPDTRVGGSSGMAGVGRRAFAAAAWAATAVSRPAPSPLALHPNSASTPGASSPSPTSLSPPWSTDEYTHRPLTPPYAHFGRSSSPALEDAQNQSQPYFLASHGMRGQIQRDREREAEVEAERAREREREKMALQARERARWEAGREQERRERERAEVGRQAAERAHSRQRSEDASRQAAPARSRSPESNPGTTRRPSDAHSARTAVPDERLQRPALASRSVTAPVPRGQRPSVDLPVGTPPTAPASASATVPPPPTTRLPFFEKYKKMVDSAAAAPSAGLTRSASGGTRSGSRPGAARSASPPIPSPSITDDEEVDSPIELGFSDNVAIREYRAPLAGAEEDEESALPWARNDDKPYAPAAGGPEQYAAKSAASKPGSSKDGSISSLSSSMAARLRLGEVAPLTPSTSADRLDQIVEGKASPPRPLPHGLAPNVADVRSPDEPPSPSMSSDAPGPATRTNGDRDSFRSSMIGPGDSISLIAGFPGDADRRSRSNTLRQASASSAAAGGGKRCQQCGDALQGRRFIQRDGVLLCEEDWKELFLPKCRRCDKPIETAAVSSADGQLKGKWHRACFTCFECDCPFDNDSFYVHADKPYCQLHYHQLNGSICSSASCRRPIEGACLLVGKERFHPTHFRCDHRSAAGVQDCAADMQDYYAVGKLRVCGAHKAEAIGLVNRMMGRSNSRGQAGGGMSAKAEKRRTRLIHA